MCFSKYGDQTYLPIFETKFARRAFSYVAPRTTNGLPDNLITCDSLTGFKKRLKAYLFEQYFK